MLSRIHDCMSTDKFSRVVVGGSPAKSKMIFAMEMRNIRHLASHMVNRLAFSAANPLNPGTCCRGFTFRSGVSPGTISGKLAGLFVIRLATIAHNVPFVG
jgi:hypothetical protein